MDSVISIIIPTHNSAHFLPDALDSILKQGVENIEVVLVDDGSVDDTPRVAKEYAAKFKGDSFVYVRQEKSGPASARNTGLRRARGRFITFLDADDMWTPDSLKKRYDYLQAHPEVGMVCADGSNVGVNGVIDQSYFRSRRPYKAFSSGGYVFDDLFNYIVDICLVLTPTVLLRRECLDAVGLFDEKLSVGEDKELWFRIGRKFRIVALPDVLLLRRIHAENISHGEMVRRVSYIAIADKIRRNDPDFYRENEARFHRWQATMHHEMGYFLFQNGEFGRAAAHQISSLGEQFRIKTVVDLTAALVASVLGERLVGTLQDFKRRGR